MTIEYTGRQTSHHSEVEGPIAEAGMARIAAVTNRCTSAHIILTEDKYRKIAEVSCSAAASSWWRPANPPRWSLPCVPR